MQEKSEKIAFLANVVSAEMRAFEETYLDMFQMNEDTEMAMYAFYGIREVVDELVKIVNM